MRTLPMPQVLRAMGLSRRPGDARASSRDWTLHLTELSPAEATAYQLSRHPALALLSSRPSSQALSARKSAPAAR
jgi:hypothetical protein